MSSSVAVAEVAESSFALLQIEAVNMWIADAPKPADYARAARRLEEDELRDALGARGRGQL